MAAAMKFLGKARRLFYNVNQKCSYSFHSERLNIRNILQLNSEQFEKEYTIHGWIGSVRSYKEFMFVDVYDGSTSEKLQILLANKITERLPISIGAAVEIKGLLKASTHKGQRVEMHGNSVAVIGEGNMDKSPLSPKIHYASEIPRQHLHLRPRMHQFAATLRIRSEASRLLHLILQSHGYSHIHTPILTTNDCEGGGAVFTVQPASDEKRNLKSNSGGEKDHFFGAPVFLTVSGQLQLEAAASALSKVYTFGPTFRAENSRSRRHLSEFYMLEIEKAFATTVEEVMEVFENLMQEMTKRLLENCSKDICLLHKDSSLQSETQLQKMLASPILRLTYDEAIDILQKKNDMFKNSIKWGQDLGSEHEQCLVKHCDNQPVFVTYFPAETKPFYMKRDDSDVGNKRAACFDVLVPIAGEVCGGSLRENDLDILIGRLKQLNLNETLKWYVDLRTFGAVPHGGFGMGFERYLQYLLGIHNIKDTIPFPRWTKNCFM